jgi:hypothetical protein
MHSNFDGRSKEHINLTITNFYSIAVDLALVVRGRLWSKADSMNDLYVILESLQILENYLRRLRLAHGMATRERLLWYNTLQMNSFNVIPHLRNAAETTLPLLIALRFVANANRTLGLGKEEREWLE